MLFGKTIVITGVSSGIGACTAELASHLGADIVGIDIRPPVVPMSSFIEADISSPAAIDELATKLPKRIDALCNVAGVSGTLGAVKTPRSISTACGLFRKRSRRAFVTVAASSMSRRSPVTAGARISNGPRGWSARRVSRMSVPW